MPMKSDPYLQFPLPLLRTFPVHFLTRRSATNNELRLLISRLKGYGIIRNGRILFEKQYGGYRPSDDSLSERQGDMVAEFHESSETLSIESHGIDKTQDEHLYAVAFFNQTGLRPHSPFESLSNQHNKMVEILDLLGINPEASPMIRLRWDLLEDWRRGKIKHFDVLCLCAIQSMIGSGKLRRITRDQIAVRMMGFPSESVFNREASDLVVSALPSAKKVSRSIARLHEKSLISVVRPSKRENFFSISLSDSALSDAVKRLKTGTFARKYVSGARDRELQLELQEQRRALNESLQKSPLRSDLRSL